MRSIVLVAAIGAALAAALAYPFAGLILWTWFALENPHEETYSFAQNLPLNLIIAVVTIAAWLFSRERKLPPSEFLIWAIVIFLVWVTFNSFFAFDHNYSWPYWDRTWKTFALALLIAVLATNAARIHAIVWACVVALFYYGVKGGLFTLLTGGTHHVLGPPRSEIGDNNQLALALLMTLPLANYLRRQSANRSVAWGIAVGMALTVVAVVGSYSRGALIGMGALAVLGILRTRRKILYLALASAGAVAAFHFMPESFWERASTIQTLESGQYDASIHGRLVAWDVAYRYATDHFPFGTGFYGSQLPGVFNSYFPTEKAHAAHSIYFQVLGEHGFIGLFLYLLIILGAFWKCSKVIKQTRERSELEWACDLTRMIQTSLFVFCVGGAALSMAYYDLFVICVLLLVPISEIAAVFRPARVPVAPIVLGLPNSVVS